MEEATFQSFYIQLDNSSILLRIFGVYNGILAYTIPLSAIFSHASKTVHISCLLLPCFTFTCLLLPLFHFLVLTVDKSISCSCPGASEASNLSDRQSITLDVHSLSTLIIVNTYIILFCLLLFCFRNFPFLFNLSQLLP